ncbi:MAG TPA: hypothetical protein DF383_08355 [Deltaproteobacteria bacterium]|nr:hypothetical protein [Deltaproteobacteria bacterium]
MSQQVAPRDDFSEVIEIINNSRNRALQAVNTALIDLYWQIGAYISCKIEAAEWGDGIVRQLAEYLAQVQPGLRGFTSRNLFRMKAFYEAYRDFELVTPVVSQLPLSAENKSGGHGKVAALLRQLPWTHHLIILSQSKRLEEREFYLRLAIREGWSKRELERQFKGALFERSILHPPKVSPAVSQNHAEALSVFKDAYLVEFLDLPQGHAESDLHRGPLLKLKDFLIELGRDFCFVGTEFPVQVGGRDFALSRTFSPALIAEYQTQLLDKKLLQAKLHEFYLQNAAEGGEA